MLKNTTSGQNIMLHSYKFLFYPQKFQLFSHLIWLGHLSGFVQPPYWASQFLPLRFPWVFHLFLLYCVCFDSPALIRLLPLSCADITSFETLFSRVCHCFDLASVTLCGIGQKNTADIIAVPAYITIENITPTYRHALTSLPIHLMENRSTY